MLQLAPFVDGAHTWNVDRPAPGQDSLLGIGVGLRWGFGRWLIAELYWGEKILDVPEPRDPTLQDRGIHFAIRGRLP